MSRYDGGYPHRPVPTERWDGDRFARERHGRAAVAERDTYEERDSFRSDGRGFSSRREVEEDDFKRTRGGGWEDDRFYEREERYGPPARRAPPPREHFERRYHEEDEYDSHGPRYGGRKAAPPRPGMLIRRQSSLDTFDRRPQPRYREPEVVTVPSPRGGRYGEQRHRYEPRYEPRYNERESYEDIRIAEPDRYGDEDYRGWKEREIETIRRRRPEPRRSEDFEEERIEERVEETVEVERPWPRRGKTRMSARLVNKRALVALGYPYEDEFTDQVGIALQSKSIILLTRDQGDYVIILKALNKELIDEVLGESKKINGP